MIIQDSANRGHIWICWSPDSAETGSSDIFKYLLKSFTRGSNYMWGTLRCPLAVDEHWITFRHNGLMIQQFCNIIGLIESQGIWRS